MLVQMKVDYKLLAEKTKVFLDELSSPGGAEARFSEEIFEAFRNSFNASGLDGVDELIASINAQLKLLACKICFRSGAALEHSDPGNPSLLHVFLENMATTQLIAHERIPLKSGGGSRPD
ncbi:MAG: hypothetical protein K2X27_27460 [Candidatus Obscuribacterales bacterium]|nr:hypothetical protein [Candidatus Obscuribacterales bacterium]